MFFRCRWCRQSPVVPLLARESRRYTSSSTSFIPVKPPPTPPPRAARPRAAPASSAPGPRPGAAPPGARAAAARAAAAALAALGLGLAVAAARRDTGLSLAELGAAAAERARALGEPDAEDLRGALPPWSHFAVPREGRRASDGAGGERKVGLAAEFGEEEENEEEDPGEGGVATRAGVLARPSFTAVLSWERALADASAWAPKRGRFSAPRAGAAALLLALADAGAEVVVWSRELPAPALQEALSRLVRERALPRDAARAARLTARVRRLHAAALAHELRAARAERRAPREMLPFVPARDAQPLYEAAVLRLAAVLGREHCLAAGAPAAQAQQPPLGSPPPPPPPPLPLEPPLQRPLGLLLRERRLGDVLVVEAAGAGAAGALREWRDALELALAEGEREGGSEGSGEGGGGPDARADGVGSVLVLPPFALSGAPEAAGDDGGEAAAAAADPSLLLVAALVDEFAARRRAEAAAGRRGATGIGAFVRGLAARGGGEAGVGGGAAGSLDAAGATVAALTLVVRERAARRRVEEAAASVQGKVRGA